MFKSCFVPFRYVVVLDLFRIRWVSGKCSMYSYTKTCTPNYRIAAEDIKI